MHRADGLVSSELLAVECRRTIDRLRIHGPLSPEDAVQRLDIGMQSIWRPPWSGATAPISRSRWRRTTPRWAWRREPSGSRSLGFAQPAIGIRLALLPTNCCGFDSAAGQSTTNVRLQRPMDTREAAPTGGSRHVTHTSV